MTHYNVEPVDLDLKPSWWLAALLVSAASGACLLLAWLPLGLSIRLALMGAAMVAGTYHTLRDALLILPGSAVRLVMNGKGEFHLLCRNGIDIAVVVLPSSFVMPYLTVLNFKAGSGLFARRSIVITPDRVEEEAFRRLRVWLRWRPQAVSGDAAEEA